MFSGLCLKADVRRLREYILGSRIAAALDVAARSPEHIAPIHRRMLAVLHFDPVLAATAAVWSIAML
jgi:hypothetical protein